MAEGVFVALLILFPLLGVASRSWIAVLLPAIAWPLFYAGLNQGFGILSTGLAVTAVRARHRRHLSV
jgi:hypothetical protein